MTKRRIISAIAFCFYIAAVGYMCFAKPDSMPKMPELWFGLPIDKIGHVLMFIPFPVLAFETFCTGLLQRRHQALLLATLMTAGMALAVGTEYIQAHLAYRSAETGDILADASGLVIGGICTVVLIICRKKK